MPCSHIPATFLAKHLCRGRQLFTSFCLSSVPFLFTLSFFTRSCQHPGKKVGNTVRHVLLPSLLFSSPFLLSILGLKLEMNAFSSLQTHPSIQAFSFFQPKLPSPFHYSFHPQPLPAHWFLPLSTQVWCDRSIHNINCCSAFILLFSYIIFVLKAYRHCLRLLFF